MQHDELTMIQVTKEVRQFIKLEANRRRLTMPEAIAHIVATYKTIQQPTNKGDL